MREVEHVWSHRDTGWTRDAVYTYAKTLPADVARGVISATIEPVVWHPLSATLGNGQHRVLAMLIQGVDRVLVSSVQG
jgi:hypothetical protein